MKKESKKCTKIASFTVTCEEKTVSFKSRAWSVWANVVLKGFWWIILIHLGRIWARVGQFRPGSVRSYPILKKCEYK